MPKLTKKQKNFADKLIKDPKLSATKAVLATYGSADKPVTYPSARAIASQNLAKPSVIQYLELHLEKAQESVIQVLKTSTELRTNSRHAEIALKAADMILDRTLGKPTTRQESTVTGDIHITFGSMKPINHDSIAEGQLVITPPPAEA